MSVHVHAKPALTVAEQIAHLKSQGVTFNVMSEQEAAAYLSEANNYLRTRSYRVLYKRQLEGRRKGEYVNLDFGSLMALSSLDCQTREALLAITIDIEHFAKYAASAGWLFLAVQTPEGSVTS